MGRGYIGNKTFEPTVVTAGQLCYEAPGDFWSESGMKLSDQLRIREVVRSTVAQSWL